MALVLIRIPRTTKPPLGTPIDWSNPLAQGLVGAWAFNEGAGNTAFNTDVTNAALATAITRGPTGPVFNGSTSRFIAPNGISAYGLTVISNINSIDFTSVGGIAPRLISSYSVLKALKFTFSTESGFLNTIMTTPSSFGARSTASLSLGAWQCVAFTWNGVSSFSGISQYLNGVSLVGSSYTSQGLPSSEGVWIGGRDASNGPYHGSMEYVFIFNHALSPAEIASLSANPWQIYEPETVWIEVGGAGEAALFAGSIYGQSSASAQLSTEITIASQVVAAGSITGGINTAIRLATSTQGDSSVSALLTTAIRMAASAQGVGASTADLNTTIALAADILAAGSTSGALSTAIRFGGALSGSSTTTAALENAITMAAQSAGLGSISGQLSGTIASALFAGTISGSSSASANLSTAVILAAAAQGSSTAQAALSTALELAAQVNGIGSAAGALGVDISGLAGSLNGSSEAQATLATAIHLMGVAAGQCGVAGRLAEPVEILAQLRVMASDPLALTISVRDPLALRVTVQ